MKKGNILEYDILYSVGNENSSNVWYIPQNVPLDLLKSILGHCYSSQKKGQPITNESIKKASIKNEKSVGYGVKMLENMGILALNSENNTYSLNENAMRFSEKLNTKEDATTEINEIIDNSFLNEILLIILNNEKITKEQLTDKILLNSAAGSVKDQRPYAPTINCILDILNLGGKISKEKYTELRGNPEQTERRTPSIAHQPRKKKEKITTEEKTVGVFNTSLGAEVLGIVKTASIEVKIKSVEDLEFAKLALNNIERELKSKTANNTTTQITS